MTVAILYMFLHFIQPIEQLSEDVYMLANLTVYLERATDYEDENYCGQYTQLLMQPAKEMLNDIVAALVNMTDVHLSEPFTFYNDTDTGSSGMTEVTRTIVRDLDKLMMTG